MDARASGSRTLEIFLGANKSLRVDLNPLKKKATSFYVRNVMIDFPTLFFEMVPKICQGSFFLPALA